MSLIRSAILATALVASAGAASAAQRCGATTHTTFGETRAYFQNSLGACRPDGYCSVVLALPAPAGEAMYAQQFRIARPTPGAPYAVELVAATPMNAGQAYAPPPAGAVGWPVRRAHQGGHQAELGLAAAPGRPPPRGGLA